MKIFKQIFATAFFALLICSSALAQREKSVLLASSEAKVLAKQCSRHSPEKFTGTWEPSRAVIKEMESNFSKIKKLEAKECCFEGAQIENPDEFYMQYVGLILDGKKLVYISAFTTSEPYEGWKKSAAIICDGGNAWGVLYDPIERKFFDLAVNGVG